MPVDLEGFSVLVVDDQPDSREATIKILERMGAAVVGANGGAEALQLTRRAGFDAVLCDLNMPGMDGFEFLQMFRRQCGGTCPAVIAVAGLVSSADHRRTHAAGFDAQVDKPFDNDVLIAAINDGVKHRT